MWWIVGVVTVVVLVATHVTWTAARVDRLHVRAAASQASLDAHLVRRAAAALEFADASGRTELRQVARAALEVAPEDRVAAENDLTLALRRHPPAGDDPVVAASRLVALTRQVHNDQVRDALALRRRRLVRLLRLTRRHPEPAYFDVDNPVLDQTTPA